MDNSISFPEPQLEHAARMFAALGEPSRLRILRTLMHQAPLSVSELVEITGLGQANVSKHLGILHQAGLVARDRQGSKVIYDLKGSLCQQLCGLVCREIQENAKALSQG